MLNRVFIIAFLGLVFCVPVIGFVMPVKTVSERENRNLAVFPDLLSTPFSQYPREIDAYLDDHFGLRDYFLVINSRITQALSANKKALAIEHNDWAFFHHSVAQYQGRLDEVKIDLFLKRLADFKTAIGDIPVFVSVVPNKTHVYPEKLPPHILGSDAYARTIDKMRKIEGIYVLDLLPTLREAKQERATYMNYDTHWNGWGAYAAYKRIIAEINATYGLNIPIKADIDHIDSDLTTRGDLWSILGYQDFVPDYKYPVIFKAKHAKIKDTSFPNIDEKIKTQTSHNPKGKGRVMVIHDSFMSGYLQEYLAESFKEADFVWQFNFEALAPTIVQKRPDFVLIEIVDRHIFQFEQ